MPDRLPLAAGGGEARRPYFETLFVTPAPAANLPQIAQEIRRLRRAEDAMIYEPVLVGSFEDAIIGTILNGKIEAVVIYDGIPVPSQHDVPLLRDFLTVHHQLDTSSLAPREVGVTLARLIKRIRPELDIYLLTDRKVEKLAGDPAASMIRRVFYEVEELTGGAPQHPRRRRRPFLHAASSTTSRSTPPARSPRSTRCRSRAASRS